MIYFMSNQKCLKLPNVIWSGGDDVEFDRKKHGSIIRNYDRKRAETT
jgi:hypothetical protein